MNSLKSYVGVLIISLVAFSFTACTEDEALTPNPTFGIENSNSPQAQKISSSTLVGDWEMTSLDYAGSSTTTQGGTSITTNFSGVGKAFTYEITYRDNPKTYTATGGYTVELTTFFNDTSSITQDVAVTNAGSSGTWSLTGNTLTVTDSATNETNSTVILRATNNTYSYDFAGLFGQSQGGANVQFTSGQITYQRKP